MMERALFQVAFSEEWGRQMRFICGPRQSGKTTLAKRKLKQENSRNLYYLWDLRSVRNRYKENELFFTEDQALNRSRPWVCFDEMHKIPKWKNILKAIFDGTSERYRFIVTGSAKLDIFKKAGDSLSGRYFLFHLFPLVLEELVHPGSISGLKAKTARDLICQKLDASAQANAAKALAALLEFSGFPEPFLRHSKTFQARWSEDYADTVVREDIGSLTRIIDREHLYDLYRLLPEMVGNPLSESSLASHLELSPSTIKSHLRRLEDFYLTFKIPPYSKNIKRALLKASKCYLYNWTQIKDPGKRFENYVAVELITRLHLWTEATPDRYGLFYIRTRQKEELDFLILKNETPWLLIETKLSDGSIPASHRRIQTTLKKIPLVQLCLEERICRQEKDLGFRISASRFLS